MRSDVGINALGRKANARAGMFEDKPKLGAVQLGVGRHRGKTGMPDAVEQFEITVRILGGDGDPFAGRELKRSRKAPASRAARPASWP